MSQLNLFDGPPAERRTLTEFQQSFVESLRKVGNIPRTAMEIAANVYPYNSVESIKTTTSKRKRLASLAASLVEANWVTECGRRPCKASIEEDESITYEVRS